MKLRTIVNGAAVVLAAIAILNAGPRAEALSNDPATPIPAPATAGEWKSGRTYLVTDHEKTIQFGGKDIVLPQGAEFQLQDGFLVVKLSPSSKKDAAVVKVGGTFLVITKREKLVIDPNGVARNPKFAFRIPPKRTPYRPSVNEIPNASPFEP